MVLWCWLRGSETHLVCHCWMMLWPTALLTSLIDAVIQRSICSLVVAAFANASAFSLPGIPNNCRNSAVFKEIATKDW